MSNNLWHDVKAQSISALIVSAILAIAAGAGTWLGRTEPVIIFLVSLFCFTTALWAWNGAVVLFKSNEKLPPKYAYGLSFVVLEAHLVKGEKDCSIQIDLILKNVSQFPLRYYLEDFRVVLENRTIDDPEYANRGSVIPPGESTRYAFKAISGLDPSSEKAKKEGTFEYSIKYGHPDLGAFRICKRKSRIAVLVAPNGGLVEQVISESDKPIAEKFPDESEKVN